jgi:hypothetical protein
VTSTFTRRYGVRGTRFHVYPQLRGLRGVGTAELIYVSAPPGTVAPGPADDRIYVVDADDKVPYDDTGQRPPYQGARLAPIAPGPNGHFDHVRPGQRAFSATCSFAVARSVLDLWEHYAGRQLQWYFHRRHRRLEIIPRIGMQNAVSRPGYLELGHADARRTLWFAENFDTVAHEMGHALVRTLAGDPPRRIVYRAIEESCADLIAVVSSLHFDRVVSEVLRQTGGRLFATSLLSRVAELDRRRHVRNAFNTATLPQARAMGDSADPDTYKFVLARPFTGAAFEVLVELYEDRLVERGGITRATNAASSAARTRRLAGLRRAFARRFRARPLAFRRALADARDDFGRLLTRTLERLPRRRAGFPGAAAAMVRADRELFAGRHRALIEAAFIRRGIRPRA